MRFSVHPSIRRTRAKTYCIGGPRNTPHILLQQLLRPGERRTVELELPTGHFHVRAVKKAEGHLIARDGEAGPVHIARKGDALEPRSVECGAGRVSLTLTNEAADEALFRVEREDWSDAGVSAAYVTTLPEFRNLFSSEALSPGMDMSIRNLSFLFSDLKGSTALYEECGDARAYKLVRDHFVFMRDRIERNRGSVVKTMGDAVMAVFSAPADAARAACEIQLDSAREPVGKEGAPCFHVKIGAHSGPCIAVSTAGVLDYFGTTVNLAARAQAQSEGEDLVLTASLADRRDVALVLGEFGPSTERFHTTLKGISGPVELVRIRLTRAKAGCAATPAHAAASPRA
ncbi:MAG: adenylate/guanylate cyclase domain-containing protein [Planctomycetes bacterium]|nr:adenylate/guanylate cyclase domain-containing protein [Planctomycetota bacterium]